MVRSREMDCRLAILRGRIETLKEEIDKNLSWFNELVNNNCFVWTVGLVESAEIPSPRPSPGGRGCMSTVRRGLRVGTVLIPLLFAEVSPLVQAARQDAERAALGHGQNRKGRAQLDPIWRENTDVRSGLWPEPWMAQAKGPSARAVGQEDEPKVPDVSRANKRGRRLLVLFAKESGSFQSHSPRPEGRAKPCRGRSPRVLRGGAAPSDQRRERLITLR
ncbi:hypothetical protein WP3S18E02_15660 [Aeromonas caviae]|nr:hypothetical protein WP3S18E02_15660 [Aeromonas caviae]